MDRLEISLGDFLKNAGITGLYYALENHGAREGVDYGISDDKYTFWIDRAFALDTDWTDVYFKAFVKYLGSATVLPEIEKKINSCISKLESDRWEASKENREQLKYINDKLLSNSYKAGFDNIKEAAGSDEVNCMEAYERLKKEKLSDKIDEALLLEKLKGLKNFLSNDICQETFAMKSIIYSFINRFWDGKSFLLPANAKKNMREMFAKDFADPLVEYLESDCSRMKDSCIECGMPVDSGKKVSIAFMKEMADDLARKRSAFWNGKVDAYLCPVCAFLYAMSPLGFQLIGNKFVFVNLNHNVKTIIGVNKKIPAVEDSSMKEKDERYPSWFARVVNMVLEDKTNELLNIQVIMRGTNESDRYAFSIISKPVLRILNDKTVKSCLGKLAEHPFCKIGSEYLNVYEEVIMNLLKYREQYPLLNRLMKASIENDGMLGTTFMVYCIQLQQCHINENKGGNAFMNKYRMRDSGYALRKNLMESRGLTSDDFLRGTIYQLLNALSVGNDKKFIEIVMRMYCSSRLQMPEGFIYMIGDQKCFQEDGYAFVLGLKGSYSVKTQDDEKEEGRDE